MMKSPPVCPRGWRFFVVFAARCNRLGRRTTPDRSRASGQGDRKWLDPAAVDRVARANLPMIKSGVLRRKMLDTVMLGQHRAAGIRQLSRHVTLNETHKWLVQIVTA